jgi:hypothetical protein
VRRHTAWGLTCIAVCVLGCEPAIRVEAPHDANAADALPPIEGVSYHKEIRPLIESHCLSCHAQDGPAPLPLHDWDAVESRSWHIVHMVASQEMPPAQTDPSCRRMIGQHWLDLDAREMFQQWADDGFLKGRPEDYEPPDIDEVHEDIWDSRSPDVVTNLIEPFEIHDGSEMFATGMLDYHFEEDTYVQGVRVVPDHSGILHHLDVLLVDEDGNPLVPVQADGHALDVRFIGGYAPGNPGFSVPDGAAFFVPAGTHLAAGAHYHLTGSPGTPLPSSDSPSVELWTLPQGDPPTRRATILALYVMDFEIPAGEPYFVHSGEVPLADDTTPMTIVGVAPHMHYLGIAARVEIVRTESQESVCVVDTPNYDFEWQLVHRLSPEDVIQLEPGDMARITCVYDNSDENQPYINGIQQRSEDVRFGDSSLDEMCVAALVVTYEP